MYITCIKQSIITDKVQPNITLILNAYRLLLKSESPNIKIKRIKRHFFFFFYINTRNSQKNQDRVQNNLRLSGILGFVVWASYILNVFSINIGPV